MDSPVPPPDNGDVNRGHVFIVLAAVFGFISTVTTAIRLSMRMVNRQLGWDDFFIGLASVLVLIQCAFNGLEYRSGFGQHIYYLTKSQKLATLKWAYITEFFLFLIICLTKISICLFVLRIKPFGWLKWCLYALMTGLVVSTLLCEIILFAQCQPLHAFWDRISGKCWEPAIYNNAIWAQVGIVIDRSGSHAQLIRV